MQKNLEEILFKVSISPEIDDGDINKAYRLVIKSIASGLNIHRVSIWFFDDSRQEIHCQLLIDTYHNVESEDLVLKSSQYPKYFKALKTERVILAHYAHSDPATTEFSSNYLKSLGINSMLDAPIRHKGKMVGILCSEHIGKPRSWTSDESFFVSGLADLIGRAINAARLKESQNQLKKINIDLEEKIKIRTAQLVESEKMAALGNLVAGVAHEVNTPLGVGITAASTLVDSFDALKKSSDKNTITKNQFELFLADGILLSNIINDNLLRAGNLISNFKKTAVDQSNHDKHHFKLDEAITTLVTSLKPELDRYSVKLNLNLEENIQINSHPSAWMQVVTNLLLNCCIHAFDNNACPEIILTMKYEDDVIFLSVEDNGNGVPKDNLDKLFLPFFTTKRGRGGTGLGLAIVYNIVTEQLGGKIFSRNKTPQGFKVSIEYKPENLKTNGTPDGLYC